MDLKVIIEFLDYWHCGSGDSGGNESDALVVKYEKGEKKGLPYVPAKTLKGLIREMVEANSLINTEVEKWFGKEGEVNKSSIHFENAVIKKEIDEHNIPYLFKIFKSTALKNGIAKDKSLREIEAVIPLDVECTIRGIECTDADKKEALVNAIKSIKRIGLSRNRGFGRCEVKAVEVNDAKA